MPWLEMVLFLPLIIFPRSKKTAFLMFVKLVTTMFENQHLNAEEADKAKDQFEIFID